MVVDVDGWWDAQETSSEWLTETEKTLAGEKPLASSVVIVEEQERKIKVSRVLLTTFITTKLIGFVAVK